MKKRIAFVLAIIMVLALIPVLSVAESTTVQGGDFCACDDKDCAGCVENCFAGNDCWCLCYSYGVNKFFAKELFDNQKNITIIVADEENIGGLPDGTNWMFKEDKLSYDWRLQELEDIIENETAEEWQVGDAENALLDALRKVQVIGGNLEETQLEQKEPSEGTQGYQGGSSNVSSNGYYYINDPNGGQYSPPSVSTLPSDPRKAVVAVAYSQVDNGQIPTTLSKTLGYVAQAKLTTGSTKYWLTQSGYSYYNDSSRNQISTKYSKYGNAAAWCAQFVSWCMINAGISEGIRVEADSVSGFVDAASKRKGSLYAFNSGYQPQPGDIVIGKSGTSKLPAPTIPTGQTKSNWNSHVGIVVSSVDSNGEFWMIDGNWGNAVHLRKEKRAYVSGFWVPDYDGSGTSPIVTPPPILGPVIDTATVIDTTGLRLRTGPGTTYSYSRELAYGTSLNVYSVVGEWAYVQVQSGSSFGEVGYVHIGYIQMSNTSTPTPTPPPPPISGGFTEYAVITGTAVNLREVPDSSSIKTILAKLDYAELGIYFSTLGADNKKWYYVQVLSGLYAGYTGYVIETFVRITLTVTPSPSPTAVPAVTPTPRPTPVPTPFPTLNPDGIYDYGDANCDGAITAADAALILRYIVKLNTLGGQCLANADANADGQITAADAALVLRFIVKLENKLGPK